MFKLLAGPKGSAGNTQGRHQELLRISSYWPLVYCRKHGFNSKKNQHFIHSKLCIVSWKQNQSLCVFYTFFFLLRVVVNETTAF